jgi:ribosomal protein S18 acetylase RimI-like enzyme
MLHGNHTLIIRRAIPDDAHAIATIHVLSWQRSYRHILPASILDALDITSREKNWRHRISEGLHVLVIEAGHHIIGFTSICPARDNDLNAQRYAEISTMYIHPDACRHGIGTQLMDAVFADLRATGFTDVVLWAACENARARKFYEKMGFAPTLVVKTETMGCRTTGEDLDGDTTFQVMRFHMKLCA